MTRRWDLIRLALLVLEHRDEVRPEDLMGGGATMEEAAYQLHILADSPLASLMLHRDTRVGITHAIGTLTWEGHDMLDGLRGAPEGREVLWHHAGRGTTYRIMGVAQVFGADLDAMRDGDTLSLSRALRLYKAMYGPSTPGDSWEFVASARAQFTLDPFTLGERVLAYQDVQSGGWSLRRPQQFFDGRFEPVQA
jgi:hypothetical protein